MDNIDSETNEDLGHLMATKNQLNVSLGDYIESKRTATA